MSDPTDEAAAFCRSILESEGYRNALFRRAAEGTLPPAVEELIWSYAAGGRRPALRAQVRRGTNRTLRLVEPEPHAALSAASKEE